MLQCNYAFGLIFPANKLMLAVFFYYKTFFSEIKPVNVKFIPSIRYEYWLIIMAKKNCLIIEKDWSHLLIYRVDYLENG